MLHSANSDPLTTLHGSPTLAPATHLYRHVIVADSAASGGYLGSGVTKAHGVNCASYGEVNFQGVPRTTAPLNGALGGAGIAVMTLYEWVPGAGRFMATGDTATAAGAGQPVRIAVQGRGRILYAHIAGITGTDSCSVYVSARDIGDAV